MALAVSKTGKFEAGKLYEAPAGWRWGSKAEVAATMGGGKESREPRNYYYFGHGGWNGCTGGSVTRSYFIFSGTLKSAAVCTPQVAKGTSASTKPWLIWRESSRPSASPGSSAWSTDVPAR